MLSSKSYLILFAIFVIDAVIIRGLCWWFNAPTYVTAISLTLYSVAYGVITSNLEVWPWQQPPPATDDTCYCEHCNCHDEDMHA